MLSTVYTLGRTRVINPARMLAITWCERMRHLCCIAHKKKSFGRFFAQIYDWKHLYLCNFLVRHSVVLPQRQLQFRSQNALPGDGLLGALTTVWQSDSSFSCAISPCYIQVIYALLYEHVRVRVVGFFFFFFFRLRAA